MRAEGFRAFALAATISLAAGPVFAGAADASQIERGHKVYQKWCYPCHGPGAGRPGTASLEARGERPAVLEERTDLTPASIKMFVRHGVSFMPTFRKTEISDADLASIAAYLTRNNKP